MYFFISYSSQDSNIAEDIKISLDKANIANFMSEEHIEPGDQINNTVLKAIEKTTHMLVIISSVIKTLCGCGIIQI